MVALQPPKAVTEENVLELLREIEQDWPTGTVWGTRNTPGTHKNEVPCAQARKVMNAYRCSETYGCSGYASMVCSRSLLLPPTQAAAPTPTLPPAASS